MRSFWSDPYPWIHLTGAAMLPLSLELCLLGLAAGDPLLPGGLDWALVGAIGALPILWMQWSRPFYLFSLPLVTLRPDRLNDTQRRILRRLKGWPVRVLSLAIAVGLLVLLQTLDRLAPLGADVTPTQSRLLGLAIAAFGFLSANLFAQVPASAAWVLLASESGFDRLEPYPAADVAEHFSRIGLPLTRLLPALNWPTSPPEASPETSPEASPETSPEASPETPPETSSEPPSTDADAGDAGSTEGGSTDSIAAEAEASEAADLAAIATGSTDSAPESKVGSTAGETPETPETEARSPESLEDSPESKSSESESSESESSKSSDSESSESESSESSEVQSSESSESSKAESAAPDSVEPDPAPSDPAPAPDRDRSESQP